MVARPLVARLSLAHELSGVTAVLRQAYGLDWSASDRLSAHLTPISAIPTNRVHFASLTLMNFCAVSLSCHTTSAGVAATPLFRSPSSRARLRPTRFLYGLLSLTRAAATRRQCAVLSRRAIYSGARQRPIAGIGRALVLLPEFPSFLPVKRSALEDANYPINKALRKDQDKAHCRVFRAVPSRVLQAVCAFRQRDVSPDFAVCASHRNSGSG